ncbi:MAG: hypothetical protein DRJ42_30270 [Deltaproteobacteria bacterium]|nr:MAG: hypothetical protein DRJ42_30270 [Deltaproteobacteria bacterium]
MNTNDSRNDNHNDSTGKTNQESIEDAVGAVFRVGRMWAKHSLQVANLALEASAETLRVTAEALADVSDRIDEPTD